MAVPLKSGVHAIPAMHASPIEEFTWPAGQSLYEAWDYVQGKSGPNHPLPSTIGYVSLGQDYMGIVYADKADQDDTRIGYVYYDRFGEMQEGPYVD